MIQNSFIFLEGIGKKLEKSIWKQGIKDWDFFVKKDKIKGISKSRKLYYDGQLLKAKKFLYSFDSSYFSRIMPQNEMWRLYDFFKEDAVFLDIEVDSIDINGDITVFGLYDGIVTKTMIKGINLNYNFLKKELQKYKLIVTFNGSSFDLPFIKKRYADLLPDIAHFDVKSVTKKVGLEGGLKQIEKALGIKRENRIVEELYNGDPLTLWKMFRATGDDYYLNLLVEYNEEDVINLKKIAEYSIDKIKNDIHQ